MTNDQIIIVTTTESSATEHPVDSNGTDSTPDAGGIGRGKAPPHGIWALDIYTHVFYNFGQAANQGFLSKSQWTKRKRQILPNSPKAMVIQKTQRVIGWSIHPVLEHLDAETDLVAVDYFDVIHKDHTIPVESKVSEIPQALPSDESAIQSQKSVHFPCNSSTNKSSSTTSPSTLITSIDRKETEEESLSIEETRGFTIINPREICVNKVGAFVPENFSKADEERLGDLLEEAYCVFHHLHLFRVILRLPKDAWIDLHYDYFDRRLPHWRELRRLLLDGILERTEIEAFPVLDIVVPRGIKGYRCFGYRFAKEEYRNAKVRKHPITDPKLIETIETHRNVKYPVQRWLEKNLHQVEMVDVPDDKLLELAVGENDPQVRYFTYSEQVNLIRNKGWVFVADEFSRRIHTNLTQLKRELRACLRVAGMPLVQIDIKNSQPLFIGLAAQRMGVEDSRYLELCQNDLYQHLADQGGWSRSEVKEQLTQAALFSANGHPHQRLPVKQLFDQEFSKIARFIHDMKTGQKTAENPKPHNKLARLAQKTEANFLIYDGVCERIRKERPDCWISTIHDSLLVPSENAEYVRAVMLEDFAKLGVHPRLEVEACDH